MRRGNSRTLDERGFTLVELLVAATVLVVGMLSIVGMLQTGLRKTQLNNQRVAATNFARELTETARQIAYQAISPSAVATALQAADPDLGTGSNPWKVVRRGTTYTVSLSVCTFDDVADKVAATAPANKCADNPTGTTGDQNGDDFRRLTINLSWKDGAKTLTFTQSSLITNPTGGLGPRITSFTGPAAVITSGTTAHFDITTTFASAVHWNSDDSVSGGDAAMVSNTKWTIDWNLFPVGASGSVVDGTYSLTAQAADDRGIDGEAKSAQVTINRSIPIAPVNFRGGRDTRSGEWVEFEWFLNPARDIVGYRVFWAGNDKVVGNSDDRRVCPAIGATPDILSNSTTSCQDLAPTVGGTTVYYVIAYDYPTPSLGVPRPGPVTQLQIGGPSSRPQVPQSLSVTTVDEQPSLSWVAPSSGSVPTFYRIYRDGTAIASRLGKSSTLGYIDPGAGDTAHTYYVSSVDDTFNESNLVPITWVP